MPALSVSDPSDGRALLPGRPGLGTNGERIVLWANYFKMDAKVAYLYRYDLRVSHTKMSEEEGEPAKKKVKAEGNEDANNGKREVKGNKLAKLIELALGQLPRNSVVATEYKQQLITKEKLELPADGHVPVTLVEPNRKDETWFVRFDGPSTINVQGLMDYLKLTEKDNDGVFPKYPEEIDALGVVLGHTPRSNAGTAAVGRNRFFAVDSTKDGQKMNPKSYIEILRGYVQSVRPATGRLLLNTNVTHGVFRKETRLEDLFRMNDVAHLNTRGGDPKTLVELHKLLSKTRIRCKIPADDGQLYVSERGAAGLARVGDGGKEEKDRPMFKPNSGRFGCPATVKFYLRPSDKPPPPGLVYDSWVKVDDYYRASKLSSFTLCGRRAYSNLLRIQGQCQPGSSVDQRRNFEESDLHPGRILRTAPRPAPKVEAESHRSGCHDSVCMPTAAGQCTVHHDIGEEPSSTGQQRVACEFWPWSVDVW